MLFREVAQTWSDVAATRSRLAKVARLAATLRRLEPTEVAAGTAMLTGAPRQGRLGVGWATLRDLDVVAADEATLTVDEVDRAFATLATTSGPGSVARRQDLLEALWGRATTDEQGLLRGLVLQEVRQGALEGVVLAAVAEAADVEEPLVRRAAMLTGDLTAVALVAVQDGPDALAAIGLEVGRPVLPMLASSEPDLAAALDRTGPARVDTKFDGMRIQVHRDHDDVAVFTRSLRDVTGDLPRVVAVARSLAAERAVLDGEALALDDDGRPRAFQDSMSGDVHLRPVFFDLLHLDGTDLLDEPLTTRLRSLRGLAPDHLADGVETDDPDTATAHLRHALAAGHEGVVVKSLDAPWEAGRRGASWVKVKVAHTLDLVVLAAEWGSGRRRGWLSNLHLGAVDDETGEVVMLGKTFKGLTDELLAWQTDAFLAREVSRSEHVVHVRPELVVEIAFDGVQASTRYPGGVTLRFARVKRYRDDKTVADADTLQTVRAIHRGEITPEV